MADKWVVYGYMELPHELERVGGFGPHGRLKSRRAAIHGDFGSLPDAVCWLMDKAMKSGMSQWHVTVVHLEDGQDTNGKRHVVRRIGDGKAWWE